MDLRKLRKIKGLTQKQLAAIIGCNHTKISVIESGGAILTNPMKDRLAVVRALPDNPKIVKTEKNITLFNGGDELRKTLQHYKELFNLKNYTEVVKMFISCKDPETGSGNDAKIISDLIYRTDSDHRGNLLFSVSEELKKTDTNYTSGLVRKIALEYGVYFKKDS
jgi:transcriptional regulator with XRE-family HTH domain